MTQEEYEAAMRKLIEAFIDTHKEMSTKFVEEFIRGQQEITMAFLNGIRELVVARCKVIATHEAGTVCLEGLLSVETKGGEAKN